MKKTFTYCDICSRVIKDSESQYDAPEFRGKVIVQTVCCYDNPLAERDMPDRVTTGHAGYVSADEVCDDCVRAISQTIYDKREELKGSRNLLDSPPSVP